MGSLSPNERVVHFADCALDLQTAELRRNGSKIILRTNPFLF